MKFSEISYSQLNDKSGVYKIFTENKCYVGSAINLYHRLQIHRGALRNNKHHNIIIQNHFNKYGEQEFELEILEFCDKENLMEREQFWIDEINPEFNICRIAYSNLGLKLSDEAKLKISISTKGNKRAVNSGGRKTPISIEEKLKISHTRREINYPILISPLNIEYEINPSMSSFCKEHGLTRMSIQRLILGKCNHHKGWTIKN
jgi:group I intron endonuclease